MWQAVHTTRIINTVQRSEDYFFYQCHKSQLLALSPSNISLKISSHIDKTPEQARINTRRADMRVCKAAVGFRKRSRVIVSGGTDRGPGSFRKGLNHSRMLQQWQENTYSFRTMLVQCYRSINAALAKEMCVWNQSLKHKQNQFCMLNRGHQFMHRFTIDIDRNLFKLCFINEAHYLYKHEVYGPYSFKTSYRNFKKTFILCTART